MRFNISDLVGSTFGGGFGALSILVRAAILLEVVFLELVFDPLVSAMRINQLIPLQSNHQTLADILSLICKFWNSRNRFHFVTQKYFHGN